MCPTKPRRLLPQKKLDLSRRLDNLAPRPYILIVCEGKKTEPEYFKGFRLPNADVRVVGTGVNTVGVVRAALELMKDPNQIYDKVWCVFDRDTFPTQHFDEALKLAKLHDIMVAYSNICFEVWFLLHFGYTTASRNSAQCCDELTKLLQMGYTKGLRDIYRLLQTRQADAIRHAETLLGSYSPHRPSHDNPSTTVHLLVAELNQYQR